MNEIEKIENRLISDLGNMISEWGNKELALEYFSSLMRSANVDSKIIVNVLDKFGEEGEYQSLVIKINEGW